MSKASFIFATTFRNIDLKENNFLVITICNKCYIIFEGLPKLCFLNMFLTWSKDNMHCLWHWGCLPYFWMFHFSSKNSKLKSCPKSLNLKSKNWLNPGRTHNSTIKLFFDPEADSTNPFIHLVAHAFFILKNSFLSIIGHFSKAMIKIL